MNTHKLRINILLAFSFLFMISCENLTEENINPNGIPPEKGKPAYLMADVQTKFANQYLGLAWGEHGYFAPMMQHVQLDAHSNSYNDFVWAGHDWKELYHILANNKDAYQRAEEDGDEFIMGMSLIMKSYIYGFMTDLWGDIPYSSSLQGNQKGEEFTHPAYDDQESIYKGILDDLEKAADLMAGNPTPSALDQEQDVYFGGDVNQWHKFANSIRLRYYMRLSEKLPDFAKDGVVKIAQSGVYIKDESEDAAMKYPGGIEKASWPGNFEFDHSGGTIYRRVKMCSVFVDTLGSLQDPRLEVWAEPVEIPIKIRDNKYASSDTIVDGIRYLHSNKIDPNEITDRVDTSDTYVGIPPSIGNEPSWYNHNPTPGQQARNPHVSHVSRMYTEASGDFLKVRLLSAAEVNFIFAEAAERGWAVGKDAETWYEEGIKASFEAWGIADQYQDYIQNPDVVYNHSIEQIIFQKWISSWTAESEAWFDYRRTGYPDLTSGPKATHTPYLPVRFIYPGEEQLENAAQLKKANLEEPTLFSDPRGENSGWSKMWLLQGTGNPW